MSSSLAALKLVVVFSLTLFLILLSTHVDAQIQSDSTDDSVNPGMSETGWSNKQVQGKLNRILPLIYDETPWKTVEQELEKSLEINIILSSSAADDSLSLDEPISCNLKGVNVRNGLRLMLLEKNATFIVRKGVIIIISKDDMESPRFMANASMDVSSLLGLISRNETGRIGTPRANKDGVVSGELISAESLLTDLVQSTFQAGRWEANGGKAKFSIIAGKAVVFCDDEMAEELQDFLQDLEFQISKK